MSYVDIRGVRYNVEVEGAGPPLVLLHGFTGSSQSWLKCIPIFDRHYQVIAVDLLGHGLSEAPSNSARYALGECVRDLVGIFDRLELPRVHLLGYSMGGRVALSLAVYAEDRIDKLIVESGSPGIASADERSERVRSDAALAAILDREGITAFVDRWEQAPLFSTQRYLPDDVRQALREQRLKGSAIGLANSLRGMGTGAMDPLLDRLGRLRTDSLLIVGELDLKYRQLGELMVRTMPAAKLVVVPDSGHAIHLERPEQFSAAVLDFLESKGSIESDSLVETLPRGGD